MVGTTGYLDVAFGFCALCLVTKFLLARAKGSAPPLPPGPKPLPLVGNLFDLPKGLEAVHWAKHKALYGPISSVSALGTTMIIVNDLKIALDLLEKRSSIYSSRPTITFGGEIVGFNRVTTFLLYGNSFKTHRRLMQGYIGTRSAMTKFEPIEEVETHRFLLRLLNEPEQLAQHARTLAGGIILKISHGYTIEPSGPDPFVELADSVLYMFSVGCQPGTWLVDVIPFLRYLPEWLPGMGFMKTGREWRQTVDKIIEKPFAFVKYQMAKGEAVPSFTSEYIERGVKNEHEENLLKCAATTLYGGGADTTVSSTVTFFLAMSMFPSALKRAQEEVDRVIGGGRLPRVSDRPRLPYIEAMVKETLRWQNVVPTAVPHVTTEDDTYMGYHIPKGAMIWANVWQMAHDPENYRDPFTFNPDRFLGEHPEIDSRMMAYGFGRRICPGKELADSSLFIAIAMTVAVFNIKKAKDEAGHDIEPLCEYTPGIISHPKPFKCSIVPRSKKARSLILSVLEEHPFEKSDADILKSI